MSQLESDIATVLRTNLPAWVKARGIARYLKESGNLGDELALAEALAFVIEHSRETMSNLTPPPPVKLEYKKQQAVRFKLTNGQTIDAVKDCACQHHTGPCWINFDEDWRVRNHEINVNSFLGTLAFAQEEHARLTEKLFQMHRLGIEEIFYTAPNPTPPEA